MRKILRIILITTLILLPHFEAHASESARTKIAEQLDRYGISGYDTMVDSAVGSVEGMEGSSFSDIVFGTLNGSINLSFTEMLKTIAMRLFREVFESLSIMRNMLIIAILGAVLKSMSGAFGGNSVGEIGFYVIYVSLVSLLIVSFITASQIAGDSISKMAGFIHALIPLIITLLIASGRYAISFVFNPAAMGVIEIAAYLINNVVMKVIVFVATVQMVNFMLPAGMLDNLTELACGIIGKGLKILALAFMSVISLQTATAPIVGGMVGRGARLAVSTVPVVGQVFAGAVDSVYYWANAVKNGVAAAAIIIVLLICLAPILKLLAIVLIYKLTAALIQPVADERIVDCLDSAGNYVSLFIVAVTCVMVMLIALLMMVMAAAIG